MSSTLTARHTLRGVRTAETRRDTRTSHRRSGPRGVETAILTTIVILLIAGAVVTSGRATTPASSSTVRVESGQTLWIIAESHPVSGMTTQQTADLIARLNGLTSGSVSAYRTLRVPRTMAAGAVACR